MRLYNKKHFSSYLTYCMYSNMYFLTLEENIRILLKVSVSRAFPLNLLWFEPIWAPDQQAEVFSNSYQFRRDIQIFKNLRGMHCIVNQTLRCASHQKVKIKIFTCLWLVLKGQSEQIISWVNTSIMKEKIWSKKKLIY